MKIEKYLSLSPFMEPNYLNKHFNKNMIYTLVAVVFHQGLNLQAGHFTSLCRSIAKTPTRIMSKFDYDWIYHDGKNTTVYNDTLSLNGFVEFYNNLIKNAPHPMNPYILVYRMEPAITSDYELMFSKRFDVFREYLHDPIQHPFPHSRNIEKLLDSDDEYKYSQPAGMFFFKYFIYLPILFD